MTNEALGRDAHWFDGDGMLSGVLFRRSENGGKIQPEFANQYILTDVYLASKTSGFLKTPILPSIATLVNPMSTLIQIILRIFRTLALVALSHLSGSQQAIKKISVANTAFYYHDGRGLATCESGPPMRIALPGLETVGWFSGNRAEGEPESDNDTYDGFGGTGVFQFMREWATAHVCAMSFLLSTMNRLTRISPESIQTPKNSSCIIQLSFPHTSDIRLSSQHTTAQQEKKFRGRPTCLTKRFQVSSPPR